MNREKFLKIILICLALFIITIWIAVVVIQFQNAEIQLQDEILHSRLYLDIIRKAIVNNIFSVETIEILLVDKIKAFNNLCVSPSFPSAKELSRICSEQILDEISYVDLENRIISSNFRDKIFPYDLSLLELASGEEIVLKLPVEQSPTAENLYYIKKDKDYYFVGSITQSEIRTHTREISLAGMMEYIESSLGRQDHSTDVARHIKYVVIQDSFGIIAATSNITSLTKIENDEFLKDVSNNGKTSARIIDFDNADILETVSPFQLENFDFGVIRLGSTLERFEKTRERRIFVIIIFSFILLTSLILEIVFYRNFIRLQKSTDELNLSRRMVEVARLGGEVAHEIKNPLNSIFMVLQRIKSEFKVSDNQQEFTDLLGISFGEIERLNQIIERFLSYSRDTIINKTRINISNLIKDVLKLFSEQAARENIKLTSDCDPRLEINIDERKIRQVLINLVKNAFEAFSDQSENKTVNILIKSRRQEVIIEVEDNGRGIDPQILPFIWDLYYSTKDTGNGIGLSVTRKIIEAHQGSISVTSEIGRGSIFTVLLPLSKKK